MSKIVAAAAIRGSHKVFDEADKFLAKAIAEKGEDQKIAFPETAFYLPMAYALMGVEVKTLKDMIPVLEEAKSLLSDEPGDSVWLPYLGDALDAGIATLLAEEMIMALRYLYNEEPKEGWGGFITDTILRSLGIQLVDGRMPGFAAIIGAAPDNKIIVDLVRGFQQRNILTFLSGSTNGKTGRDQLLEEGVELGWDTYIVPLGPETISTIYALNWAIRAALTYGGHSKGEGQKCLEYCKNRVFAFGLALGEVDDIRYATGAGAINMGFPVIADTDIPEVRPTGVTTYESLVKEMDYTKIVPVCIEVRGVKIKVKEMPIPVLYGAAFEGERVRRADVAVEVGGKYTAAFEFLVSKESNEVEDGKIEVIGPEIDEIEEGGNSPFGLLIEVYGRKMQVDYESILERRIHNAINEAMGVMHIAQRDMVWIRINKEAKKAGFKFRHIGEIVRARLLEEYEAIVDKVQVTIYTILEDVERIIPIARKSFNYRDERVAGMTDESVDTFYSCTLCQSFAPNHVCIISPERLGLCGAYNWLDGRTNYEIAPTGPNQPVPKGKVIDPVKGQWENINEFVYQHSNKTIEKMNLYSLMEYPMTSCGCFECIMAIIPEGNGFMIVNREYPGMTPSGMAFTTMAGAVGGGMQTPGFLGVGRLYIISRKFISADGGLPRVLWMPKELKEALYDRLVKRAEEIGMPDLIDKIADETVATTSEELLVHLEKVGHPALTMPSLF